MPPASLESRGRLYSQDLELGVGDKDQGSNSLAFFFLLQSFKTVTTLGLVDSKGRVADKMRVCAGSQVGLISLMPESEEELKSLLMKVKEESEKADLKLNIQKTNIMASSHITSWQIMGKQGKPWQTLFSWAPKSLQMVTCSHEMKRACSLGEKLWSS